MIIKPMKTEQDYELAMERLEEIFDSKVGTKDGDEMEILSMLIERYEDEHFPIHFPDPVEAIKFRIEQLDYSQNNLARIIGQKGR